MNKDNYRKSFDNFKISEDFKDKTKKQMIEARNKKKERKTMNMYHKLTITFASAAAILVGTTIFTHQNNTLTNQKENVVSDKEEISLLLKEDTGITIPKTKITSSTDGVKADMLPLFVYQGKVYVQRTMKLSSVNGIVNKDTLEKLKGDYLGETKGGIDEWSGKEDYIEDFVSNMGEGKVYTVNGYDSKYVLMVYTEFDGGYSCEIYSSFGGLTLNTGADFFDILKLKNQVKSYTWESFDSWNNAKNVLQDGMVDKNFQNFIDALYDATPIGENTDMFTENADNNSQKFVYVTKNDNLIITLRLFQNGYVYADGAGFFKLDKERFDSFYNSLTKVKDKNGKNDKTSITITLDKTSYPVGTKSLVLKITNSSNKEYYYGMDYRIEKPKNGKWVVVPGMNDIMFIEIAKSLPANTTEEFKVDLSALSKTMKAGKYRVVKSINGKDYYAYFRLTK